MPNHPAIASTSFSDLVHIVRLLRAECPWDREQTHESIKDLLLEEAYEAVDTIDQQQFSELKKELGDLLLHVVFHSVIAQEGDRFNLEDVILGLQEKLIRRHPHVFASTEVSGSGEVVKNWESIKMKEGRKSVLQGVPQHLPALLRAERMQEKAAAVGFQWPDVSGADEKLNEEIAEFREALRSGDQDQIKKEFGDLLFSLVNIARYHGIHPEESLRLTNNKFQNRFSYIEKTLAGKGGSVSNATLEEMDALWDEAKKLGL